MLVYVDALFRSTDGLFFAASADCTGIRDVPPFRLEPQVLMTITSDGEARIFDGEDDHDYLDRFCRYIDGVPTSSNDLEPNLRGDEPCVGWYIDQVLVPSVCATAFRRGIKGPTRWMRKLNDKWTKPVGFSLERAFLQGWYPEGDNATRSLCLDDALAACGCNTLDEIAGEPEPNEKKTHTVLMSRLSAMSILLDRYNNVSLR